MDKVDEVDNPGNTLTRRAFFGENKERSHRLILLCDSSGVKMPTAYRYILDCGYFGKGLPSPLHKVIEQVRVLVKADRKDGEQVSYAREIAEAPLRALRLMLGDTEGLEGADAHTKLNFALKSLTDVLYLLKGRTFEELTPAEAKECEAKLMDAASLTEALGEFVSQTRRNMEAAYPGAPIGHERLAVAKR